MDQSGYVCKGMKKRLYEAAKSGNVNVVKEIEIDEVTPGGNTVLHIAAFHGSLHFVQKLIGVSNVNTAHSMQPFLRAKNKEGNTALHEAALGGHEEVVNALLQSCSYLVNEINLQGETALFKACEGGHVQIVKMLCPLTSSVYSKRFDGQTPLHLAVSTLRRDVIEELLNHKPELATEVDIFNRTPLHMAALIQFPVGVIPYFSRNQKEIRLIGEMLIKNDNGVSCYKVDQNKQSALHVAVKEGNAALVEVILNYSTDCLEMVDKDGRSALHLAVDNAVDIFVRVGGKALKVIISSVISERLLNCIDNNGQTAFDIALEKGNEDPQLYRSIIRYLHKHGAMKKIIGEDSRSITSTKAKGWKSDLISVSAVLIATVAFAAVFTLPGGIGIKGNGLPTPILINTNVFKIFVIFDTMAFCYSIASAILLNFACFASQVEDPVITEMSSNALWIALVSLSITFGAAIHLVVATECLWLAVLVWVMVCLLPICIRAMSLLGKGHVFPGDRYILLEGFNLVFSMLISTVWVARAVVFSGVIRPSLRWVRKKIFQKL